MQKMICLGIWLALMCGSLLLVGCGQKGDLYLPQGQFEIIQLT